MMLSIDSKNQVYIGLRPVTMEELRKQVAEELERTPELRILVRADKRVEYKTCKELMIACGEVGAGAPGL